MFGYPLYLIYAYVAVAPGCATPAKTTTASSGSKYSEDVSVWRPKTDAPVTEVKTTTTADAQRGPTPYVEPKLAVNKKLDAVLDSIDRINLSRRSVDGFTIQVYSGKREEAMSTKRQLASTLGISSEVQFTEPIFRVKAGKYYSRLDAQRDYVEIKKHFPSAIVIPDRISIN
jgi:hypothetical protein